MIYIFGDIHFSSSNDWKTNIGNNIIKWFNERFDKENKSNSIIFLGDIVDNFVNPGTVVKQVDDLFNFCSKKFNKVVVITGNHDVNYFKHKQDNFLSYIKDSYPNVILAENVMEIELENKSFLLMPHIMLEDNHSLSDYYSNFDWKSFFDGEDKKFDYALGHWVILDKNGFSHLSKTGVDTKNIPANKIICGHVHNRVSPNYTGSLYACNPTEVSENRVFMMIDENNNITEEQLPIFVEYIELSYPNKPERIIDNNKWATRVYTISGISNEAEAINYYKGLYIKGLKVFDFVKAKSEGVEDIATMDSAISIKDIIGKFFDDHEIDTKVCDILKDTLNNITFKNNKETQNADTE